MTINPIGGAGGGFDPERRKSSQERAEEAKDRLREHIAQRQAAFRERMRSLPKDATHSPGRSLDSGTVFDSADLPDHEQDPPAKRDGQSDSGLNEVG